MSETTEARNPADEPFRLGEWIVEPRLNRLTRDGESIQIELKMMDVLVCLAEHAGELVERQELIDTVWATEFISENILTRAIAELRSVLGDDARNPSFVETIHRRGYRLIAAVETVVSDQAVTGSVARSSISEQPLSEERSPYPGLFAFHEDDARFFFGREAEVSHLWRKLSSRRLLAMIGPSGVGKSSLVRAGLVPAAPDGWSVIVCQPGDAPYSALARALAPEFREDPDAIAKLVDIHDADTAVAVFSHWRGLHHHVLLVIDQFEELFTRNPNEIQESFSRVLRRLADQCDVNVLLAMRDDFLITCNDHESLSPVFSDLTPIKTPERTGLRRAVVNPADGAGYTFEDEDLIDEILDAVEGEQGALPLLAFTVARLWEERDRERRLMTREAYERIGGVHGSLALHAEATLAAIGGEGHGIVRELFRNLVTAQGTRAARDVEDLLSVFENRGEAADVLAVLTDARLLNVSEVTDDEGASHRSVEIVHESLLAAWPRLVRWQTQDADAAQLRDQIRQAARLWDDHDRSSDFLWTGRAIREYSVWRENYPGGLSEIEEDFATAMTSHAGRRKRRRRMAVASAFLVLFVVLGIVGVSRQQAIAETNRAEASKLLVLAEIALGEERTGALAYAIASLERSDTTQARRLALRSLWEGPPATILPKNKRRPWSLAFSPDGRHLAVGHWGGLFEVLHRDGSEPLQLTGFEGKGIVFHSRFSPDSRFVSAFASEARGEVRVWNTGNAQPERIYRVPDARWVLGGFESNGALMTMGFVYDEADAAPSERYGRWDFHRWDMTRDDSVLLGRIEGCLVPYALPDLKRGIVAVGQRDRVELHRLENLAHEPGRVVARHSEVFGINSIPAFDPVNDRVALGDSGGHLLVWPLDGDGRHPERRIEAPKTAFWTEFSPDGALLTQATTTSGAFVWDLEGPVGAEPLRFHGDGQRTSQAVFSPDGRWLATTSYTFDAALWPLTNPYSRLLRGHEGGARGVLFSPDSTTLFSQGANDGTILAWDLAGGAGVEPRVIFQTDRARTQGINADPGGRYLTWAGLGGQWLVPLDGRPPDFLEGFPLHRAAVAPDGRLIASNVWTDAGDPTMVVLDTESGERWELDRPGEGGVARYFFDQSGHLVVVRGGVLSLWDPQTRETRTLVDKSVRGATPHPHSGHLILRIGRVRSILNSNTGGLTELPTFCQPPGMMRVDATGTIAVTAHENGDIRVGRITENEPHLLLGSEGEVRSIEISPDGRWIASSTRAGQIRLWPMPDLDRPPLLSLDHDELLSKLKRLTNMRVVPVSEMESHTGYHLRPDGDAYHGWAEVPEW